MKSLFLFFLLTFSLLLSAQIDTTINNYKINRKRYYYEEKGYIGRIDVNINPFMMLYEDYNIRLANGYKFNQYAQLYGLVGFDTYFWLFFGERFETNNDSTVITKGHEADPLPFSLPIGAQLRGDVGKKKTKFFYALYSTINIPLNYSYRIEKNVYDMNTGLEKKIATNRFYHTLGTSFGLATFSKSTFNFSTGINVDILIAHYTTQNRISKRVYSKGIDFFPFIGINMGFGW